jgi:hypothetical protein
VTQPQPSRAFHYRLLDDEQPATRRKDGNDECHWRQLEAGECSFSRLQLDLVDVISGKAVGAPISLTASVTNLKTIPIFPGNELTQIATARSVVSFDDVLRDLGKAAAEVAVERARSAGEAFIQHKIAETFCEDLTVGRLWRQSSDKDSPLAHWLPLVGGSVEQSLATCGDPNDGDCKKPLLPNTCKAARGIRVSDMAASGEAVRRAVMSDLASLVLKRLERLGGDAARADIKQAVKVLGDLLRSVMLSDVDLSEKQAQALLVSLASTNGLLEQHNDWRDTVQLAVAIAAECLQQGECSSDQLHRALSAELPADPVPGLQAFALNVRDVLRPAQGTPPRETVARALQISLTALDWAITAKKKEQEEAARKTKEGTARNGNDNATVAEKRDEEEDAATRSLRDQIKLLRSLVETVESQQYGTAIQLAGGVLAELIRDDCEGKGANCEVALKSSHAEKWFGVLGAFASYAGSYAAKPESGGSSAEIATYQAEQRKAAMQDLIDAATDRRGREGDVILSAGIGVQGVYAHRSQRCDSGDCSGEDSGPLVGASLPAGLALELLPSEQGWLGWLGFHSQVTLLDLGQFANVANDDVAEPSPATPLYFGGQVGVLIGGAKYNLVLAVDAGYAPAMDFDKTKVERGGFRVGGVAGMYVPFMDLN